MEMYNNSTKTSLFLVCFRLKIKLKVKGLIELM